MSGEQIKALEFLQQLQQSGQLQYLLSHIPVPDIHGGHGGSMNDSSKRRLDEESVFSDDFIPVNIHGEEETEEPKKKVPQQMPVLPGASSLAAEVSLPSGHQRPDALVDHLVRTAQSRSYEEVLCPACFLGV